MTGAGLDQRVLDEVCHFGASLIEAMCRPAMLLDGELRIVAANALMSKELGMRPEDLVGAKLGEGALPGLVDRQILERLEQAGPDHEGFHSFQADVAGTGKAFGRWLVIARQVRLEAAGSRLTLLCVEDAGTTNGASSGAGSQSGRGRSIAAELALAEEGLRRRVAVNIHDGPVQTLVLLHRRLGALRERTDSENAARVEECLDFVRQALDQARQLMYDLSPPILHDLGLVPALDWLVARVEREHESDVSLITTAEHLALSRPTQIVCFRAVRELLLNAVKHAPGSEVVVIVSRSNGSVQITVHDTGPGFDASRIGVRADGSLGYGLLSVLEQVRGIGGEMEVNSVAGEGTRVTITVPIEDRVQESKSA